MNIVCGSILQFPFDYKNGVAAITYAVMYRFHFQARLVNEAHHVIGVVHFAVSVRERGKIEACHCETHGCGHVILTVP